MIKKTILVDAWNTLVTQEGINRELKSLLDTFDNPKLIVTNANEEEMKQYGIIDMPYPVFSLAHDPNKTSSEYFIKLMQVYSLSKEEVVYFEHNKSAIESAMSIGISSFWYNPENPELEELALFLKSNL